MSDPQNDTNLAASPNPADERRTQLASLIPEAFSEGKLDLAALRRALGERVVIEGGERYALTWAGKSDAYKVLQTPSTATLRPERDKSVNFDQAQHVFIEGENLEVLKVLQKAYFGKVKLIYIDPPYNTGSDSFIYPDRFQESKEDYLKRINDLADDGTLMREGFFRKNGKESGHYHSNWLSMMLPRLYIARNLMREDGFVVISIDDNELHNLRAVMNEVMGEENFVAVLVYDRNRKNDAKLFSVGHEYMVVYARNKSFLTEQDVRLRAPKEGIDEIRAEFERLRNLYSDNWEQVEAGLKVFYAGIDKDDPRYPLTRFKKVDKDGPYRTDGNPSWPGGGGPRYNVPHKENGKPCKVPKSGWRWPTYERMKEEIDKGYIVFGPDETTIPSVRMNLFENTEQVLASVIFSYAQKATQDLDKVFDGKKVFDNPKSYLDLERLVAYLSEPGDIVLDFFAGSGTTAHGVLRCNQQDTPGRKFVCVQIPEPIRDDNEAGKNALAMGYETISDLCRDRIRRVFTHVKKESDLASLAPSDLGFQSFVLAPSNFKQWRGDGIDTPEQLAEQMLMFAKSEKEGAQVEDMLYELLLRFGQELTTPIESLKVEGGKVFAIHDRKMLFVLESFTEAMIVPLVEMKPREIIAIDGVFNDSDMLKTNLDLQCRDAGIRFTCL
jgi:adenine-specific DNA-methyltransferase